MTTVDRIISRALLQAAAEKAWFNAKHLHNADEWKIGRQDKLPLPELYPRLGAVQPWDMQPEPVPQLPFVLCQSEADTLGVRIILTAPTVDNDWFWIACRFHWRNGTQFNYTV